jgi:hypothetical protein
VVDLDNLEGEFDDEEDGGAQDDSDVSVKSESYEDELTAKALKEMREAAGEIVAPTPMSALSDDAEELIKAFVPKLSSKATEAVVQFVIEHLRDKHPGLCWMHHLKGGGCVEFQNYSSAQASRYVTCACLVSR